MENEIDIMNHARKPSPSHFRPYCFGKKGNMQDEQKHHENESRGGNRFPGLSYKTKVGRSLIDRFYSGDFKIIGWGFNCISPGPIQIGLVFGKDNPTMNAGF